LIIPTPLAVAIAAAGAPVALLLAVLAPALWPLGLLWVFVVSALIMADAVLGADRQALEFSADGPTQAHVGTTVATRMDLRFRRGRAPGHATLGLETNALLKPRAWTWRSKSAGNLITVDTEADAVRRGEGEIARVWIEWRGPLRLVTKRRVINAARIIHIVPNTRAVREEALKIFARETSIGTRDVFEKGGGSEFEALRDFMPGMDRRTIDWKQSARHTKLLAKEFRTEQDQTVILAIDTGRLMSEPVANMPKIDHAVGAAMLLAYVGLKMGDRIGLFGFDAKPSVTSAPLAGIGSFGLIQKLAARLDYSTEETNFTLGLTQLSADTQRRSLIVIFTDFADPTSAELMIENVGRLVRKHLVLFVAIRDHELETLTAAEPTRALDANRAVIAQSLLLEREVVLSRLQRLGVELIDAPISSLGPELLNRYLDVKRASRL
jgi:uncharacterized protein (DUF58 family)